MHFLPLYQDPWSHPWTNPPGSPLPEALPLTTPSSATEQFQWTIKCFQCLKNYVHPKISAPWYYVYVSLHWSLPDLRNASLLDLRNSLLHICSSFPNVKKTHNYSRKTEHPDGIAQFSTDKILVFLVFLELQFVLFYWEETAGSSLCDEWPDGSVPGGHTRSSSISPGTKVF